MTSFTVSAPDWIVALFIVLCVLTVPMSLVKSVLDWKLMKLRREADAERMKRLEQRGRMCFWCGKKHVGRCRAMPHNYNPPNEDEL